MLRSIRTPTLFRRLIARAEEVQGACGLRCWPRGQVSRKSRFRIIEQRSCESSRAQNHLDLGRARSRFCSRRQRARVRGRSRGLRPRPPPPLAVQHGRRASRRACPARRRSFRRPTGGTPRSPPRRSTAGSTAFIGYVNQGGVKHLHPDFGGSADGNDIYGFPYVVVDGAQAKRDRPVRRARRERRRDAPGRRVVPVLSGPGRGDHAGPLDRGRRPGQRRRTGHAGPAPPDGGSRPTSSVRALQRLLRRSRVAGLLGRVLRHEHRRPPSRRLDLRGRRGTGDPARPGAVGRGVRGGRDPARVPLHGPAHERLRLSRVAPRGTADGGRAPDGRAPAAEGRRRTSPASTRGSRRSSAR